MFELNSFDINYIFCFNYLNKNQKSIAEKLFVNIPNTENYEMKMN
jgi:hypothetical protein